MINFSVIGRLYICAFANRRSALKLGAGLAAESRSFTNHIIIPSTIAGKLFSRIPHSPAQCRPTPNHPQSVCKFCVLDRLSHVDGDIGIALPFVANFAAGAIAGISEILVFYPLDVVSMLLYWRDAGMKS